MTAGPVTGRSGARTLATLVHELEPREGRHGLAMTCIGGGHGVRAVVERVAGTCSPARPLETRNPA